MTNIANTEAVAPLEQGDSTEDALALLDQWAAGAIPDEGLASSPPSLSQQQMRSLWDIVTNPGHKQTLSMPYAPPR